jgi:hypothetical protein
MAYVCMHLNFLFTHSNSLGSTTLGASLVAYVCVAFEPRSTQLSFFRVYSSWSIISDLCVFAFEPRNTPLRLSRVYNSWSIISSLCVFTIKPRSTPLSLSRVYSSWSIINGLCVFACKPRNMQLVFFAWLVANGWGWEECETIKV